jgi:hypothetical protein
MRSSASICGAASSCAGSKSRSCSGRKRDQSAPR